MIALQAARVTQGIGAALALPATLALLREAHQDPRDRARAVAFWAAAGEGRVSCPNEFISRDLDLWAYGKGVTLDFSRPGKPTDNAYIEAFNGRFRAECLNAQWFLTLADAAEKLEDWRRSYNGVRPHGAIGHKGPISLLNPDGVTGPPS